MRPAGAVSQVPRDAGSAIQSCCAQSTSSASGWKARRARSTCTRAAGSKRSSCQPKPVTSTQPSSAVSAYSQFRPGPMPTAMPCGSTPRASISTFTALPALAPAASATRGGSAGAKEICGQAVERHRQHQRLGLVHLAARGGADDAGVAVLDPRHRRPQAQVDDVACHRLGQRAPSRQRPVCQAREQPGQAAVLVDRCERVVGGAMVRARRHPSAATIPAGSRAVHRSAAAARRTRPRTAPPAPGRRPPPARRRRGRGRAPPPAPPARATAPARPGAARRRSASAPIAPAGSRAPTCRSAPAPPAPDRAPA